jgi:hypothetical protein
VSQVGAWWTRSSQSFRGNLVVSRVWACKFEWFNGGTGVKRWLVCLGTGKPMAMATEAVPTRRTTTTTRATLLHARIPCCLLDSTLPSVQSNLSRLNRLFTRLPRSLYHQHAVSCVVVARRRVLNALLTVKTRHLPVDHEVLDHRSRAILSC